MRRDGKGRAAACPGLLQALTLVKVLVIRDWMLLVVVLKFLQICAMRRAAKSRRAQWLSTSGLRQSWRLTMQVMTAGMTSCSCSRERDRGGPSALPPPPRPPPKCQGVSAHVFLQIQRWVVHQGLYHPHEVDQKGQIVLHHVDPHLEGQEGNRRSLSWQALLRIHFP